jgi:hypothetical protein
VRDVMWYESPTPGSPLATRKPVVVYHGIQPFFRPELEPSAVGSIEPSQEKFRQPSERTQMGLYCTYRKELEEESFVSRSRLKDKNAL